MRLLVDEDVDVRIIGVLKRLGHVARRVPSGATNGAVISLARKGRYVLLTRDADFTDITRYPPARSCGVIHLAIHPPWLERIVPPLTRLLKAVPEHNFAGRVVALTETGHRAFP